MVWATTGTHQLLAGLTSTLYRTVIIIMGNETGKPVPQTNLEPVTYFAINIKQPDKLHIVPADGNNSALVTKIMETHHSVQDHGFTSRQTYTITLSGHPFSSTSLGDSEASSLSMRSAWCRLLAELNGCGWEVVTSSDLAQKRSNSTIFFRKMVGQLAAEQNYRPFTCIAPSSWDKLIFINLPKTLESRVTMLVETGWGVQDTKILERTPHGCSFRMKMTGSPWSGETGAAGVQLRQLLLDLVKLLQTQNFKFVANINFKGTSDCFFFEPKNCPFGLPTPELMFAISLNRTDRLRVISAPSDVLHLVAAVIQQEWARGIQQVKAYHGSQEYKLSGTPWWSEADQAVDSRRLIGSIIACLKFSGWDISATMEISRQLDDKTLFLFKQARTAARPQRQGAVCQMVDWVCLSFHETDKIRLCSGPGKETPSQEILRERIRVSLESMGEGVIQRERNYHSALEWKLSGTPFSGTYGTGGQQRSMISFLCRIIKDFNSAGWRLVCSADISAKYHTTKHERYPLDVHSWFFILEPTDRLHLAALNPPSQFHRDRLTKYLSTSRGDLADTASIGSYGQFDLPPAYHQVVDDEEEEEE